MGIINFLNKTFSIDNTVSVPILISLIVFIIGGLFRLFFNFSKNYFLRLHNRNSFRNILIEIIRKCQLKAKQTEIILPTLNIEYNDNWSIKYTRITYLELAFQQDLNSIYISFRLLFMFRNLFIFKLKKKRLRQNAFNKTWSILENLKYFENKFTVDVEKLENKLNKYQTDYSTHIEELRKQHDKFYQPMIGKKVTKEDFPNENELKYFYEQDKIWKEWQDEGDPKRRNRFVVFQKLIKPLHELNLKNQNVAFTLDQNNILLAARLDYDQMTNLLSVYYSIFNNYYMNYRTSWKVLEKCLKIMK